MTITRSDIPKFRAYCSLCGWKSKVVSSEFRAQHAAAGHLWALRGRPDHSREAADIREQKRLAKCPTPWKTGVYRDKEEALEHVKGLYRKGKGNPDVMPYQCACGRWHVGHSREHFYKRIRRVTHNRPPTKKARKR